MHRVYIAWSHALFHRSISLLLEHPQLTIVGDTQDLATAHAEIEALHPDTLIVEMREGGTPECSDALRHLQARGLSSRLICVSLHHNMVSVYRRQQYSLEEAHDLLHLVLGEQDGPG